MTTRRPVTAALALALLALPSCGSDESADTSTTSAAAPADAEAAIEETWATFVEAVDKGDGQGACAELSAELARPGEVNFQLGSILPGGPSCEDTLSDKQATLSFAAGLSEEVAELKVDGTTADGIAGAAKPTFAESDGEWAITSFFGVLPEE